MNFFERLFSIDEAKTSAVIVGFFASLTVSFIWLFMHGEISSGLLNLDEFLIGGITGVSIFNRISSAFSGNTNNTNNTNNMNSNMNMNTNTYTTPLNTSSNSIQNNYTTTSTTAQNSVKYEDQHKV